MSHPSSGYFYCRYIYTAHWDSATESGFDDDFHTAYYTAARKDHEAQTRWLNNVFRPEAQVDCERIITRFNLNHKGRVYRPYDWNMVTIQEFMWTSKLPVHTVGNEKGKKKPFGREI
jgi:hypothetical protein